MFEQVDGHFPQPVVDLAAVDIGQLTVETDPLRRRRFRGDRDCRALAEQVNGFDFGGEQRRFHTAVRGPLNDGRDPNELRAFHIIGHAGLFVEIGIACNAVVLRPCAAANRYVVGVGDRRKNRVNPLKKAALSH